MPSCQHLSRRAHWAGGETIVSALMARTIAQPELISLAAGFVNPQTLPVEPTREAVERLATRDGLARAALQYGTTIGYLPLRDALLERTLEADRMTAHQMGASVNQLVVTAGSNQLLYLVSDTLLDPGDVVLCGAPSYFVYMGTVTNLGARAYGVAVDEHGVVPEAVDDTLRRFQSDEELHRVKAIYVTTYFDNPTGITLPEARRVALVELAERWSRDLGRRLYVIEDIAYRELRYHSDDQPSLRSFDATGETVIQAGTFSKSFSPGLRIGWGLLPKPLVDPVLAQKGNIDFGSPNFNQILMSLVLNEGLFDAHVETVRQGYREKLDATLVAADRHLAEIDGVRWIHPTGGLYLWVALPEHIDTGLDGPLFDRAIDEGMMYVPGVYCYPTDGAPPSRNMIRLSFGIQSPEEIERGIAALARAIQKT